MNSRERIITAARRKGKTDVVPVAPYMGNFGASVAGVPISEYNTNSKKMAQAQIDAWKVLKQDVVVPQSDNYYIAEGWGCVIEQPYNNTPHIVKHPIEDLSQVYDLKVPDPYKDGRMAVYIDAVNLLKKEFQGEVGIRSGGTGPFSLAGHIFGTQNLLIEIALAEMEEDEEKQKAIMHLMDITSDALIAFSKAIVEAGCDFACCGDSSASPDLTSPAIYEKYIYPFEKKVFKAVKPVCEKYDAVSLLHICGNTTPILQLMADTGADILEIDHKVNLKQAKELCGDKVCIMGNVDPSSVLLQGTPEDVRRASEKCIEDAGKDGGFILGSGCEVGPDTPIENIKAMIEVARNCKY